MKLGFGTHKTIVLVGMMGVGKTSVGRRLAKRLSLPFSDTDHEVEMAAGYTISDIYEKYGEAIFRDTEKRIMKRILKESPHVISTGVGTFADEETQALVRENAVSVWLYAELEAILPRITPRSHRPQLMKNEKNVPEILKKMMEEYHPVYEKADIKVHCMHKDTNDTVEAIIETLNDYCHKE